MDNYFYMDMYGYTWNTMNIYGICGIYGIYDVLQGSTMVAMDERLDQMLAHLDGHSLSRIRIGQDPFVPVLLDIHGDSKDLKLTILFILH